MAQDSNIEWTDATWNPVRGCSRISPGCGGANHEGGCYAEKIAARFSGPGQAYEGLAKRTAHGGQWTGKVVVVENQLETPQRWRSPRRIFLNSMSDLFHEALTFKQISRVIDAAREAPQHIYQVLTKRSARMREFSEWWCMSHAESRLPSCLWFGVSVEDQQRADERIPDLLATPAAVRFLSCEPLLGPVDLTTITQTVAPGFFGDCLHWHHRGKSHQDEGLSYPKIDWVICGGESGPRKRPTDLAWHRSLRDQCAAAGAAFFEKQIDKVQPIPDDLMVRQFPT